MVIAVDGPSGVGKSTVSRAVAAALGIPYLDTGSYYRAATLAALDAGADPADPDAVLAALRATSIEVDDGVLVVAGTDTKEALRSPAVTAAVSTVAAHREVRAEVVALQQEWVRRQGGRAVVEGRDIGTVVFPDAPIKVFLTASAEVRAARRAGDTEAAGASFDQLRDDLQRRDRADSTREVSPLRPADDAVIIDTSDLDAAAVVQQVLGLVGAI